MIPFSRTARSCNKLLYLGPYVRSGVDEFHRRLVLGLSASYLYSSLCYEGESPLYLPIEELFMDCVDLRDYVMVIYSTLLIVCYVIGYMLLSSLWYRWETGPRFHNAVTRKPCLGEKRSTYLEKITVMTERCIHLSS